MRCQYIHYKGLYEKRKGTIIKLSRNLIARANAFYGSSIFGIDVSDMVHAPNLPLIDEVVLSAIIDIERIKDYHPINNPTRYKYAAYTGFWWLRVKPFMCKLNSHNEIREVSKKLKVPNTPQVTPFSIVLDICKSINEVFISGAILGMIHIAPNHTSLCDTAREKMVKSSDIKDSIEYFLRYRPYNAQGLELFLKGLNTCPLSIAGNVGFSKGKGKDDGPYVEVTEEK